MISETVLPAGVPIGPTLSLLQRRLALSRPTRDNLVASTRRAATRRRRFNLSRIQRDMCIKHHPTLSSVTNERGRCNKNK